MRHCAVCGASLGGADRFCSRCGAEAGLVVLDPLGSAPQRSSTTVVAGPSRRSLRRGVVLAGVLAAGVIIWQLVQRDQQSETADPPSTLTALTSAAASTVNTPAAVAERSSTTSLVDRVDVPSGLTGQLVMVTQNDLIEVDLATGAVAFKALDEQHAIVRLVPLGDVVVGLGASGAVAFSPVDGSTRTLLEGVYMSYLGDDGHSLLGAEDSGRAGTLRLLRGDGEVVAVQPDVAERLTRGPIYLHDGKVVIAVGQGVGLIDPITGEGRLLGEGGLVAADDRVLVRVVCEVDLECEWIVGSYDDELTRAFAAPSVLPSGLELRRISADGSTLVGLAFGSGAPVLHAIDLHTGAVRSIDNPPNLESVLRHGVLLSPDGRWLVTLDSTGEIDLTSLDGQGGHTIALALTDTIQALTIRH